MAVVGQVLEQGWEQILSFLQLEATNRPTFFAVLVVLVLGFVGGKIVAELVRTLLKMTALDEFAIRSNVQSMLRRLSYRGSLSDLIADIIKWGIYTLTVLSVMQVFGFQMAAGYSAALVNWGTKIALALAVLFIGVMISGRLEEVTVRLFRVSRITGLVDDSGAEIPIYVIAGRTVKYIGVLVSFLAALGVAGIDILFLNVVLGVIGFGVIVALVLATRDLFRSIAASIYLQLSRVFAAGDTITIGEYEGEVGGMRPLYTELEDGDTTFYIPNWKLVTEVIEREEE